MKSLFFYSFLLLLLSLNSCTSNSTVNDTSSPSATVETIDSIAIKDTVANTPSPAQKIDDTTLLKQRSLEVLNSLRAKTFIKFSEYIHPEKGVRFSPYAFIDAKKDKHFLPVQFVQLVKSNAIVDWGVMDGSGDTIRKNFAGYYRRFIYDKDFTQAPQQHVNKTVATGNSLNNQDKIYAGMPYAEYYFPGQEEKYGGMDWRVLRLVFAPHNGQLYLVAVIHDEWTT